jgi:hypothetical protein
MSDENIQRITVDMASSCFITLIGDNMQMFVDIVNLMLNGCQITYVPHRGTSPQHIPGKNMVIPRGPAPESVHWIFVDETGKEYNPYNLNMQVNGSDQFCQSHSLKMAYNYCLGTPQRKTNKKTAFLELLDFWQSLIVEIKNKGLLGDVEYILSVVEADIFSLNLQTEEDKEAVHIAISNFPKDIQEVLDILKTPYAISNCPNFL